jgi:predicted aspartyl protease
VDALIDTGFTGEVSLRGEDAACLGLVRTGPSYTRSAGSGMMLLDTYDVEVDWCGRRVSCSAVTAEIPDRLIGSALLNGHRVVLDYGPAKSVEIEE